jgi:hypothetical protein
MQVQRVLLLCTVALLLLSGVHPAMGKRKGGKKRPHGNGFGDQKPQGNGERPPKPDWLPDRPQDGFKPPRGPPGLGIFSSDGTSTTPTMLSNISFAGAGSMVNSNGEIMLVYQNRSREGEASSPVLVVQFSKNGVEWTSPQAVTIAGLPAEVTFTINPTLTLNDSSVLMYFTGSNGKNLRESPSAIHVARWDTAGSFTYIGVAFSMDGSILANSAVAGKYMIVPHHGKPPAEEDESEIVGRKLLKRKGGRKGPKPFSNMAYLATGSSPTAFVLSKNITLPSDMEGKNSWDGSLLLNGNQLVFYGTGRGPWPIVSNDEGANWNVSSTPSNTPSNDPSVIPFNSGLLVASVIKHTGVAKPPKDTAPAPAMPVVV